MVLGSSVGSDSGPGDAGWENLGSVGPVVGAAIDDLTVSNIPLRDLLMVLFGISNGNNTNVTRQLEFNGDSSLIYSDETFDYVNQVRSAGINQFNIDMSSGFASLIFQKFGRFFVSNLAIGQVIVQGEWTDSSDGHQTAERRIMFSGRYGDIDFPTFATPTGGRVTSIRILSAQGAGLFFAGSYMTVFGRNLS